MEDQVRQPHQIDLSHLKIVQLSDRQLLITAELIKLVRGHLQN